MMDRSHVKQRASQMRGLDEIVAQSGMKLTLTIDFEENPRIMPAIDDLKLAVANLGASISAELTAISNKLSNIPPTGTSDAAIQEVVTSVNTLKDTVDAETAALA